MSCIELGPLSSQTNALTPASNEENQANCGLAPHAHTSTQRPQVLHGEALACLCASSSKPRYRQYGPGFPWQQVDGKTRAVARRSANKWQAMINPLLFPSLQANRASMPVAGLHKRPLVQHAAHQLQTQPMKTGPVGCGPSRPKSQQTVGDPTSTSPTHRRTPQRGFPATQMGSRPSGRSTSRTIRSLHGTKTHRHRPLKSKRHLRKVRAA